MLSYEDFLEMIKSLVNDIILNKHIGNNSSFEESQRLDDYKEALLAYSYILSRWYNKDRYVWICYE